MARAANQTSGIRLPVAGSDWHRPVKICQWRESDLAPRIFNAAVPPDPFQPQNFWPAVHQKLPDSNGAAARRDEIAVGDLICAGHQFRPHHAVGATQVIGNKFMARVGNELAENAKGQLRRQAVTEQRMRRDARKPKLNHRAGRKRGNALEPQTRLSVMLMIFPEQCHEQVDIEQPGYGVWLSSS